MTQSNEQEGKRILGDLRIFQSVFNDLNMKHELMELADGTQRWVYTYEGTDPYELEDGHFKGTVVAIKSYRKQHELDARLDEIKLTKDNSDESYLGEDWFSDENIKDNSAHEVPLSYFVKREAELKAERSKL